MKFACQGFDRAGRAVNDTVDAPDAQEAAEILHRRGIFASQVRPAEVGAGSGPRKPRRRQGAGARTKAVAGFVRQLSVLVATGTPMADAIASIERQLPDTPFRTVVRALLARVEEGAQLSEAMALHPDYFDGVCRSLVAAGESGGKMEEMLARLGDLLRQQVRTRQVVQSAMIYPALLMVVAVGVTAVMLGFVLPRFEGLFKTLGGPLPSSTRVLMQASTLLRQWWPVPLGLFAGLGAATRLASATPRGALTMAAAMRRVPLLNVLRRSIATARIVRVLGVLLTGKVAMVDSLRLLRQSAPGVEYTKLLTHAEELVMQGESLSVAFADDRLIVPAACEALRSGERSGRVGPVLLQVADALDEENELSVKTFAGLVEPLILLAMGVVVGCVAISMFLPLFDLAAAGGSPGP
ncbi:MAG: type II secretion system F family protein [Phycisphaerales bacterium]